MNIKIPDLSPLAKFFQGNTILTIILIIGLLFVYVLVTDYKLAMKLFNKIPRAIEGFFRWIDRL